MESLQKKPAQQTSQLRVQPLTQAQNRSGSSSRVGHLDSEHDSHSQPKKTVKIYNNPHAGGVKVEFKKSVAFNWSRGEVFSLAIDPEDKYVACGCGDGKVRICNMNKGSDEIIPIKTISFVEGKAQELPLTCLKWKKSLQTNVEDDLEQTFAIGNKREQMISQNSESLSQFKRNMMVTSTDGSFKEISASQQRVVMQRSDTNSELFSMDFDQKGYRFATGGKDTLIRVYDTAQKELLNTYHGSKQLPGHSNRVQCVKWHPRDCDLILTGGWDSTLVVYDTRLPQGGPALSILGPHICGEGIDVRSDNGLIMTAAYQEERVLEFWDFRKHNLPVQILDWNGGYRDSHFQDFLQPPPTEHSHLAHLFGPPKAFLYSAKFTHDNQYLVAGGGTGKNELRVFRTDTGQVVSVVHDLPMSVLCVDTAAKSNRFAFGSSDAHVRVCEIRETMKKDGDEGMEESKKEDGQKQ